MGELTFAAAILLWGVLPGLMLLWAADVDWSRVERAAASAGISLALVSAAAYLAEVIGLPVRPVPVLLVIAAICAIVFALRRQLGGDPRAVEHASTGDLAPGLRWLPWLVWLLPIVVIMQLQPMWRDAVLPPPMHDGLDHANWFRLIYELGSLDPHVVMAPPLTAAGEPTYYPWGMHAWAALVARTTALDPVVVLMRALVLISAAVPLSVYAFTAYFTGRGWIAMIAAGLTLVFWWVPYQIWGWGGYPLMAGAIASLPVSRLALAAEERRHFGALAAAAACMAGLLLIHPSQFLVALILCCGAAVTLAGGRALSWRNAAPFALALVAVAVALMAGGRVWEPVSEFVDKARTVGAAISADPRYRTPVGTYFDSQLPLPGAVRVGVGLMFAAGAIAAVLSTRLRPLLVLHLSFGLLVLIARHQTWATALWYHLPERIWYAQVATLPALAAAGLASIIAIVSRFVRRWVDLPRSPWQLVAWLALLWVIVSPLRKSFEPWATLRIYRAVHRNPQLALTDWRVLPDFAWMRANLPHDAILFNAPADWGLPLPFTGHRTVYWSGGYAIEPSTPWNDLLNMLSRGDPDTAQAAAELSALGIDYIYAARLSAALERRGRVPLDGTALRTSSALSVLYDSPTAMILRVADARPSLLGLSDSARVRFEGFYRVESSGARQWRWTGGRGRVFITHPGASAQDCFVRVLGPDPAAFTLLHDGAALERTARGYRIPKGSAGEGPIALEIVSPTFAPADKSDDRLLGVSVRNIAFSCER